MASRSWTPALVGLVLLALATSGCASRDGAAMLLGTWEDADHNLWTFEKDSWTHRYRPIAAAERHTQGTWSTKEATESSVTIDVQGDMVATFEWSFTSDGQQAAVYGEDGAPRYWHRVSAETVEPPPGP